MKLISLELTNFRQHRSTMLEFQPGVTGIIGKNGAGKTTVLEAITWALYGGAALRGNNETVRCKSAEGNSPVQVVLSFDLGAHTYVVTRRLDSSGKSSANMTIDGLQARTGFREVTDAVTKLLGMDYQAFFTSFFTGQKEMEFMRGMDGRARAAAISRMLGYERLVRARDKANQDKLGLQREIEGLAIGMGDINEIKQRKTEASAAVADAEKKVAAATERVEQLKSEVDRLKPLRDLSEEKSKRYTEISRRLELDRAEKKRASTRAAELKSELEDLAAKEKELQSLAPQLEEFRKAGEEYRRLAELQKHEAARRELQGQLSALEQIVASLDQRTSELASAPEKAASAEKQLSELDQQVSEVERRIDKEREMLSSARHRASAELEQIALQRKDISQKREAIAEAGQDGKCPTCERPLADELEKVLAGFDDQLKKMDSRSEKLRVTISDLEKEPESLNALMVMRQTLDQQRQEKRREKELASMQTAELAKCRRELAEKQAEVQKLKTRIDALPSGFDQERFGKLREIGERLKPVRDREIQLKTALERRGELQEDSERELESLSRVGAEIKASEDALAELAFSSENHAKLVAEFEQALGAWNAANIEAERALGDLKAAQAALTAAENDEKSYKSREAELKAKQKSRTYLQTLAEAFDTLRNDLNSRAAPELAASASEILSDLTDGRYTTLDVSEDYEAKIRDDGELKPIISGGEEDIVNLSLRLAVSRMIADRAGQDMSLLILDEVFGSLDDNRRDNVVNLLQNLKTRFDQIILITHVESIHDAVDNCIWVDFDESSKVSSIRTELTVSLN